MNQKLIDLKRIRAIIEDFRKEIFDIADMVSMQTDGDITEGSKALLKLEDILEKESGTFDWVPFNFRKPTRGRYLVTYIDSKYGKSITCSKYNPVSGEWSGKLKVLAWANLPEPF